MSTYAQRCPAGIDSHHPDREGIEWTIDGTCPRCGSLAPDTLMARLEAGDVEIEPTGCHHKAYIHVLFGERFKQTYREGHRVFRRDVDGATFYFQHLSIEQQARFAELLNDKRVKFGYPGYFYVAPLFLAQGN